MGIDLLSGIMSSPNAPWGLRWRSSTLFITSTVGIGLFTDLFLYGLVVPILPFMLRDRINLPEAQIQSYVSALLAVYAGASVLFSLPAGILADRTSTRQLPFLAGLVAQLVATLMLLLGQNIPVLVIARMLQGVSAAVVWTIGLALVLDTVGPGSLGKTIGSVRPAPLPIDTPLWYLWDARYLALSPSASSQRQCSAASYMESPVIQAFSVLDLLYLLLTSSCDCCLSRRKLLPSTRML